jgi:hypothetical protein
MLAMLQLQMLVNSTAGKQQHQAAHQSNSANNANAKLLQMLAGTAGVNNGNGSQMPRSYGNGGDQNQQRASTSMARSFNGGNNAGEDSPRASNSRAEIVQVCSLLGFQKKLNF